MDADLASYKKVSQLLLCMAWFAMSLAHLLSIQNFHASTFQYLIDVQYCYAKTLQKFSYGSWVDLCVYMNMNVHLCWYICAYNAFVCTIWLCTVLWGYPKCQIVLYTLDLLLWWWWWRFCCCCFVFFFKWPFILGGQESFDFLWPETK